MIHGLHGKLAQIAWTLYTHFFRRRVNDGTIEASGLRVESQHQLQTRNNYNYVHIIFM